MNLRSYLWLLTITPGLVAAQSPSNPLFYNRANGHYYEAVVYSNEADFPTWEQARNAAAMRTLRGVPGYLATITSQGENDFLIANIAPLRSPRGDLWIGGTDEAEDGQWRWATGPEAGTLFWSGGPSGTAVQYADWAANSPNDAFGPGTESRLGWVEDGWNDLPDSAFRPGFIVEYSGVPPTGANSNRGPDIIELRVDPERLYVGQEGYAVVVADASAEGAGALVGGIELSVNGEPWQGVGALDGLYEEVWEAAILQIGPFTEPENLSLCARARDFAGVTGPTVCTAIPTIETASFGDFQPPLLSELQLYRSQVLFGQDNQVIAFADDTSNGGSRIQNMQYQVRSRSYYWGEPVWHDLVPVDGAFNETFESATMNLPPLGNPGHYEICVRAVDSAGNFSLPSCIQVEVLAP